MTRTEHRQRKSISVSGARLLPFLGFRYSTTRDAYVLRVVGNRMGPVYQVAVTAHQVANAPAFDAEKLSAAD